MPIRSFIIANQDYRKLLIDYLDGKEVDYIINRQYLMVFRYHKICGWLKEISLTNTKHAMVNIIELNMEYILVTHYSNFFTGFRRLMRKRKIGYISVDNPTSNNVNKIMFNFIHQYSPNCHESFDLAILFDKLKIEKRHEFPMANINVLNDVDASKYAIGFANKFQLEIINSEYHLINKEQDTSYHIKLLYDFYDIVDICNSILSSKTPNNIIMLIGQIHLSKRMRIPLLITREICRKHNRDIRILKI